MDATAAAPDARDDDWLDAAFHALADRTRRALLERLAEGPAKVTELAEPFAISLAAVSKHIRVLERAGLVQRTVDGRIHHCALDPEPLRELDAWLSHYRAFWSGTLDELARYVEEQS